MTRSFPRSLAATLAVLCIVLASCGDDENPVAVDSPCDDDSTTCLTITLTPAGMTHSEYYDNSFNQTSHGLTWDGGSLVLRGYAPGQRIMVTVNFNPPLEVRYDHVYQNFSVFAGSAGSSDRLAQPTTSLETDDWTVDLSPTNCRGVAATAASGLELYVGFAPVVVGTSLHRVAFDFVVPDVYTSGGGSGTAILPGDLDVDRIQLSTDVAGDRTGDPPVWQGEYEPAVNAHRMDVDR